MTQYIVGVEAYHVCICSTTTTTTTAAAAAATKIGYPKATFVTSPVKPDVFVYK